MYNGRLRQRTTRIGLGLPPAGRRTPLRPRGRLRLGSCRGRWWRPGGSEWGASSHALRGRTSGRGRAVGRRRGRGAGRRCGRGSGRRRVEDAKAGGALRALSRPPARLRSAIAEEPCCSVPCECEAKNKEMSEDSLLLRLALTENSITRLGGVAYCVRPQRKALPGR